MEYIALVLLGCLGLELISCYLPPGVIKQLVAWPTILIISGSSAVLFGIKPAIWTALIIYFSAFRIINLFKLIDGRKQLKYLRSSFLRSSLVLTLLQLVMVAVAYIFRNSSWNSRSLWEISSTLLFIGVTIVGLSLRRSLVKTRPKISQMSIQGSLPSLSVLIPARNETADLEQCLESLLRSDYPKLEIIVLDDCSQESRTPQIIRRYAQAGVRFIAGKQPPSSWTAKNYAYQQLINVANGQLVMFIGVDTRFETHTLSRMVELMRAKRKTMVSFMPLNVLPRQRLKSLLIQPLRYLWELGLPRRSLKRPPVLSTCWMLDKNVLIANGGFKGVSRNITPERFYASQTAKLSDGYSFVCLGKELGLSCKKNFDEQFQTAIRTRYPLLKQRLEAVSLLVLIELLLSIGPLVTLVYGIDASSTLIISMSALCILLTALITLRIAKQAYGTTLYAALIAYPFVFIYDVGLLLSSMWRYEFEEVVWKGRNVCVPVMQLEVGVQAAGLEPVSSNSG